eukprot:evm.model.scf_222.9 EVM.evm.TU.scf_222.9   scf_222:68644-71356(-)
MWSAYAGNDWPAGINLWFVQATGLARESPVQLAAFLSLVLLASSAGGLLLWMLGTPLNHSKDTHLLDCCSDSDSEGLALENGEAGEFAGSSQVAVGSDAEAVSALVVKGARHGCWSASSWEEVLQDLRPLLQDIAILPDTAGALPLSLTQDTIPDSWPMLPSQPSASDALMAVHRAKAAGCSNQEPCKSLSNLHPQLGRSMRRQAVTALDNFWSKFFDLHGRPLFSFSPNRDTSPPGTADSKSQQLSTTSHSRAKNPLSSIANDLAECLGELHRLEGGQGLFEVQVGTVWEKNDQMVSQLCYMMVKQCENFPELGGHSKATALTAGGRPAGASCWKCGCDVEFMESVQPWCCLGKWAQEWVLCDPRDLLYVFGLWCMVRLLELCKMEPRPELWGRYAAVLNRLQWMLPTMMMDGQFGSNHSGQREAVFQMLDEVESSVQSKRGPKGTAAGDVAFPKGKEIIMSVIKRYNRGLKPGGQRSSSNRPERRGRSSAVVEHSLAAVLLMAFTVAALSCSGGNEVRSGHMM